MENNVNNQLFDGNDFDEFDADGSVVQDSQVNEPDNAYKADGFDTFTPDTSNVAQALDSVHVDAKSKKKSKKKSSNNETSCDEPVTQKQKVSLFVLTDKLTPHMMEFARDSGLAVSNIFTSVDDLKSLLMTTFGVTRIVVVDSGTGRFVAPATRKDLIDAIGMADDDVKFTVFYTSNLLKEDAKNTLTDNSANVEWVPYKCTSVCVAVMLMHKDEEYVYDSVAYADAEKFEDDIMKHVGKDSRCKLDEPSVSMLNLANLYQRMFSDESKELPAFVIEDFSDTFNKLY